MTREQEELRIRIEVLKKISELVSLVIQKINEEEACQQFGGR